MGNIKNDTRRSQGAKQDNLVLNLIDYWWVRAGLIEILELFGIDGINPPLRTRTGEYVGGDSIDLILSDL
jgi:hypothetical protein